MKHTIQHRVSVPVTYPVTIAEMLAAVLSAYRAGAPENAMLYADSTARDILVTWNGLDNRDSQTEP